MVAIPLLEIVLTKALLVMPRWNFVCPGSKAGLMQKSTTRSLNWVTDSQAFNDERSLSPS